MPKSLKISEKLNSMAEKEVVPEHVSRTLGREAQQNNILAARVIANIVKTTLGPKGMDKMLVDSSGNITVTNDGVTILEEMEIDHPAARIIVDIARTQEREVGDGTTTVALLAGMLLEQAQKLIEKRIHPTVIIKGYERAAHQSRLFLDGLTIPVNNKDILRKIAMTAMTGKGAEGHRKQFADLIIEGLDKISKDNTFDTQDIRIQKVIGGRTEDSVLVDGVVLDKEPTHAEMPRKVMNAKIALIDFPLEIRGPETETRLSISSPEQLQNFLDAEERALRVLSDRVIASGATVVFCQKGIDDVAQYYLAQAGIYACRRVSRRDMEHLAKATSAAIVSNAHDLGSDKLGSATIVEEVKHGSEGMTYVRGCPNPKAVTLLVRGSTQHVIDELERALTDGIGVVSAAAHEGRVVVGGGAVEIELARKLREFAHTSSGREQLAIESFANALESIPETLAENAGLDVIEVLTQLRKRHQEGHSHDGLNLFTDSIGDCAESGIVEPLKVKTQAISSATEVATMILRIDDVLVSNKKHDAKEGALAGLD